MGTPARGRAAELPLAARIQVVWFALATAPVALHAVAFALRDEVAGDAALGGALLAVGGAFLAVALLWPPLVVRRTVAADGSEIVALRGQLAAARDPAALAAVVQGIGRRLLATLMIGFALGEAGGLLSGIALFAGGSTLGGIAGLGLFLCQWVLTAPTRGRALAFVRPRLEAAGLAAPQVAQAVALLGL